jgi:hypothetical protein
MSERCEFRVRTLTVSRETSKRIGVTRSAMAIVRGRDLSIDDRRGPYKEDWAHALGTCTGKPHGTGTIRTQ